MRSVLGNTLMRRMIGRYKGFRCARMVAGVKRWEGVKKRRPGEDDSTGPQELEELRSEPAVLTTKYVRYARPAATLRWVKR